MKASKGTRSILITLSIASAAVAYSFLVFVPSQKALARLRLQLREKQLQIVDADRLISVIAQTESTLKTAKIYAEQWEQDAPSEARLSDVYRQFATFADKSKVQLNGVRPQSTERLKTISQFRVALECSGSYSGLFEFIHLVESAAPALWIHQLEMDRPDPQKELIHCKLMVTIFVDNPNKIANNSEKSG